MDETAENAPVTLEELAAAAKKDEAKKAELGNFDPFEAVRDAKTVKMLRDEKLGVVKYGALTYKESRECSKIEDREERTVHIVWLMLKKAHPQLTREDVESMPVEKVARLSALLGERIQSFLPKKTSPTT